MKKLLCAALFATFTIPRADTGNPKPPWGCSFRGDAEFRYDDNILGLSDTEVRNLRSTDDPVNDERYRIEKPNDFIFNPSVAFGVHRKPAGGPDTTFGMSIGTNQYLRDTIKNYQEYRLWARQELNRSREHRTTLGVGGSRIPSYFLRQLVDDDLSVAPNTCNTPDPNDLCHNSATYKLTTGYVELSQEIINRILSAEARYARERRDYNHHFDERDASSEIYGLSVSIYPTGGIGFRLRPYYEHEKRTTRGDTGPTTTSVEDDAGFDGDVYGLEARGLWGADTDHRNTLRGYYQWETKEFTSSDPNDAGHFGREDRISRFGIGYGRELGRHLKLNLSGYHRTNDVSTSTSTFARNVIAFSVGYEFEK